MPTIERTLTTSAGIDEVGVDSDLTTAEQTARPPSRQCERPTTVEWPLLGVGLQKIRDDAAE